MLADATGLMKVVFVVVNSERRVPLEKKENGYT